MSQMRKLKKIKKAPFSNIVDVLSKKAGAIESRQPLQSSEVDSPAKSPMSGMYSSATASKNVRSDVDSPAKTPITIKKRKRKNALGI